MWKIPQEWEWLAWDPFQGWEASHTSFEAELSDAVSHERAECALPPGVDTGDVEDAQMAPEGFTTWF